MVQTICIKCSNKNKCPKFQDRVKKLPEWVTKYEEKWITDRDRLGKTISILTYVVHECKYFAPKQKPKLSPIFNIKPREIIYKKHTKLYVSENEYEEKNFNEISKIKAYESEKKQFEEIENCKTDAQKDIENLAKLSEPKQKHKKWTQKDVEFLKVNFTTMNNKKLSEILKRDVRSIFNMAQRLDLHKIKQVYTKEQEQLIKDYYLGLTQYKSLGELSKAIGKTIASIQCKRRTMNVSKSDKPKLNTKWLFAAI